MKKRLTDYFIKKGVNRLINNPTNRNHRFLSLKEAHDILIFYETKDRDEIEPCLETLRMLRKNVQVCLFSSGKVLPEEKASYLIIEDGKDINRLGYPTTNINKKVNAIKADILIDLTRKNCYPMKYLMLQHPSIFKIGLKRGNEQDIYDLAISVTDREDMMYLFGQIIFYLQTIRSK